MKCTRHDINLLLHAHGQLGPVSRLLLESHLETCELCRARWARLVVERDSLRRTLSPMPLIEDGARRVMDSVGVGIRLEPREETHAAPRPGARMLVLFLAAALLSLAVTALAAFWQPLANSWGLGPPASAVPATLINRPAHLSGAGACPLCPVCAGRVTPGANAPSGPGAPLRVRPAAGDAAGPQVCPTHPPTPVP